MFRTLLIASTLLVASASAFAHGGGYGRVVSVEPYVSISFGTGRHDGFRVIYESGGQHYWTYTPYYPGHVIVVPPPHRVHHIHHYVPYPKHFRHHHRHWRDDDRRGWDDRRGPHRHGDWR